MASKRFDLPTPFTPCDTSKGTKANVYVCQILEAVDF